MLKATLTGVETIEISQGEIPEPHKGEVRLKIIRVGICGSDIHAYYGKHPTVYFPIVQGHEISAVVDKLGEGVTGLAAGQRVTVRPQYQCGECYYCKAGKPNVCLALKVIGCGVDGGGQEFLCVPTHLVIPLPDGMGFDEGAMVEPAAVALANIRALSRVEGQELLILGAGTIGNLTAQAAGALGAKTVAITDVADEKLEIARRCGIGHVVHTGKQDLKAEVERIFGPNGPDAVLECVGVEATINQAIAVSRKGSEIIVVGVYAEPPRIDMINVQEKELRVIGVLMYLERDYQNAVKRIADGGFTLGPLMSRHFPLREYGAAYQFIKENPERAMKVFIDVGQA